MLTNPKPMASRPVRRDETPMIAPLPYLSNHLPNIGEVTTAHNPPRLTAVDSIPLDHPSSRVIGSTNTESMATAIMVLVERLIAMLLPAITHP